MEILNNESSTSICLVSLGCDKNLVDSEIMLGLIDEEGYDIIADEETADILIINTCGFILDATQEGIENILRLEDYRKSGNCKGLIVTGCMAQRYSEEIFKELPAVDAVIGTGDFENIGTVIKNILEKEDPDEKFKLITDINRPLDENLSHKRILSTPPYFAYLKIAEGCDGKCTYCTIPSLRGAFRSRALESLVEETQILADKGVTELVLVAQDTSIYGKDIYGESRLHVLLQEISKINGIEWIRILYCYPEHITDELIEEMATNPKVCHYLDMPIQHSNNKVLKMMGRKSSTENIKAVVGRLRAKMPDISIRTTLIVGFPGETDEEFNSLIDFINEVKFDRLGVFSYSQEEGTPASILPNQIDPEIKEARKDYAMAVQKNISAKKCEERIGTTLKVIIDGKIPEENVYCGRSYMDCLDIDGLIFFELNYEPIAGTFVDVKITEASDYDLIGDVIYENESAK